MPASRLTRKAFCVGLFCLQALRNTRFVLFAFLAGCLFVSACSTRFFYERLDWFIVWEIGSYVDLTDAQENDLQRQLQTYLESVRVNEMPEAAEFLRDVAQQVEAEEVTAEVLDARYDEVMAWSEEAIYGIVPISSRFLLSLSDEQVGELIENFHEVNDEMYEEYSGRTAEEREKNRNKSAVKSVQRFTGRLSSDQKQIIKDHLARMSDSSEQWIAYQREWQERFRVLLLDRPPEPEFTEQITLLFVYPRSFHSQKYKAAVEGNRQIFNLMMEKLLASLTDKQRRRVVAELEDYAELLTKLAELPA